MPLLVVGVEIEMEFFIFADLDPIFFLEQYFSFQILKISIPLFFFNFFWIGIEIYIYIYMRF